MLFSSQLSLSNLVILCRVLRHNLGAGLSLIDVFRQQAERGPQGLRAVARRIETSLRSGEPFGAAVESEKAYFPTLFLAMARVGEETGNMPEIFGELEDYFALQMRLRRQLVSQSILPVLQFVFAIFIIAGLIWVLGMIAESRGAKPMSLFGLTGTSGALTFLASVFGSLAALVTIYFLMRRWFRYQARVHAFLLNVPVLGPCLEAIALNRLALCLQLTLNSGMPIMQAVKLSLNATGNAAYAERADQAVAALKKGKQLTEALTRLRLLPPEFIDLIAMSEEGGRVPEMMRHQAEHYQEETGRRLTALTRAATGGLWLVYAGFMIFTIFSIAQMYIGAIDGK